MLIMFIDVVVGWVLDGCLSEQQTHAMLIIFIDADVGWVLDDTTSILIDNSYLWLENLNHH
jgi:hypothetical protein